ncbi:MAG: DsbA family oxidoreductase [Alphaproteobacteria bacterium]
MARGRAIDYTQPVIIDIISDVVCPWCFIGKRRLERALAVRPDLDVEVVWRAFQLNPDMPPEGMERAQYLAAKFGSDANAGRIYAEIEKAGAGEGIDFAFDRIHRTPNTVDAHRLIRFAGEQGRQDRLVELLFRRYFEQGVDIGEHERLVEAAAEADLDAETVRAHLASDVGVDAVRVEDLQARRLGVSGVPCFVIDRRFAISGAQAPEVFRRVFETAEHALATA